MEKYKREKVVSYALEDKEGGYHRNGQSEIQSGNEGTDGIINAHTRHYL